MTKFIIIPVLLLVGCTAAINEETVNYEGETILVGTADWNGLTQGIYGEWFIPEYQSYTVYSDPLVGMQEKVSDVQIKLFLGTWCDDSKFQVPQFVKILDYLKFDHGQLEIIALERLEDKALVSPEGREEQYDIHFVPTFVFERNGEEIGRITEFPEVSLEVDMAGFLLKQ